MPSIYEYPKGFVLVVDLKETPAYVTGASDVMAIYMHEDSISKYYGFFRLSGLREIDATLSQGLMENYAKLQKERK